MSNLINEPVARRARLLRKLALEIKDKEASLWLKSEAEALEKIEQTHKDLQLELQLLTRKPQPQSEDVR